MTFLLLSTPLAILLLRILYLLIEKAAEDGDGIGNIALFIVIFVIPLVLFWIGIHYFT